MKISKDIEIKTFTLEHLIKHLCALRDKFPNERVPAIIEIGKEFFSIDKTAFGVYDKKPFVLISSTTQLGEENEQIRKH